MASQVKDLAGSLGPVAETIRLAPKATYVPEALRALASWGEGRQIARGLAAFLLDRHLRRLARMRHPLELRLGRLLARLQGSSGYLELGFAGLADYATERLGISGRRMQVLLQIDRGLEELPFTEEAYRRGVISHSQLRLLMRIATPETEARWVERARRLTVRLLEEEIQAAAREAAVAEKASQEAAGAAASDATATPEAAEPPIDEEGRWESFRCPEPIRGRWEYALEICRASAGRVADRQSEDARVRLATSVTVRRLRDEVGLAAGRAGDPARSAAGLRPDGMTPSEEIEPRSPRRGPWSGVQTCARTTKTSSGRRRRGRRGWDASSDGGPVCPLPLGP